MDFVPVLYSIYTLILVNIELLEQHFIEIRNKMNLHV